ncbi:MAG: NAD(P)H-binding protein [Candidatus Sulfotelmatobacter sp.]
MKIALIGATGNVGTRLISELRRRGHQVTAIARYPEKLDRQDGVNPAVGDVQNESALAAVLAGHDVASGHLIPIDEPHELAKEIASFMGGLPLSRDNA